jgi:D-glycero-alpha-D-manno-heptose-7-phosphate kinase
MKRLIITKTPMRISFVGGGTDIPEYYEKFEGAVLNATINKYVYIIINKYHDENKCLLKYSRTELVKNINEIKHPLIKNALKLTNSWGLDINSISDISSGTGLGSSSSFTVGLLHALKIINSKKIYKENIAELASKVEITLSKSPIGKQDQYAASYGGFNKFIFKKNGRVIVNSISNQINYELLKKHLLIINTGVEKNNFKVLSEQKKNIEKGGVYIKNLEYIKNSVDEFIKFLKKDDFKICGEIIHQNWMKKKELSKDINNDYFDKIYNASLNCGAYGGKILGAGGRGFLLIMCPIEIKKIIKKKLNKLKILDFNFDFSGTTLKTFE